MEGRRQLLHGVCKLPIGKDEVLEVIEIVAHEEKVFLPLNCIIK